MTVLLLVLFCGSSALADTFGLGTAGPSNYGVLETGPHTVSFTSNGGGISVGPGASASQANLGINSGGNLNTSGTNTIQGTYYKFSTNTGDGIGTGTTIVGGTNTSSNSQLTTAASNAATASSTLSGLTASQTFNNLSGNTTFTAAGTQTVIQLTGNTNLNNNILTLSGNATQSFVINVSGNITLGNVTLIGGLTAANVIFQRHRSQ